MEDTQRGGIGVGSRGPGTTWIDVDLDSDLDLFFGDGAIPVRDLIEDREPTQLLDNRGPLDGFALAGADGVSTATVGSADGASLTRSDLSADQILNADRAVAE
jgi:hypothetical protein